MSPTRRQLLAGSAALAAARSLAAREIDVAPTGAAYELAPDVSYLNHASIGTVPSVVMAAHERYLRTCETNPWLYIWGDEWDELAEGVHDSAAEYLGCSSADVAVSRNTTAAFGLLANGLEFVDGERDEVLFSSLIHVGASASWEHAAPARGYSVRRFEFPERDASGLSEDDVVRLHLDAISERTAVLVLPHVDNVIGLRHPVARIAREARSRGVAYVCVDAAQTVGMLDFNVAALGADLFATSAHKWLQAPKGTGLMVLSERLRAALRPLVVTWGQGSWKGTAREYTDFGTRALPALLSLGDAIAFQARSKGREAHHASLFALAQSLTEEQPRLHWRSPRRFEDGAALVAVGLEVGSARAEADRLFKEHGIVLRPFEGKGRNHLRISPNLLNTPGEIKTLFERLRV